MTTNTDFSRWVDSLSPKDLALLASLVGDDYMMAVVRIAQNRTPEKPAASDHVELPLWIGDGPWCVDRDNQGRFFVGFGDKEKYACTPQRYETVSAALDCIFSNEAKPPERAAQAVTDVISDLFHQNWFGHIDDADFLQSHAAISE